MYRTHTCGQLRAANVNETVTLAGWVQKVRNLGAMTFIDLRDRYGITQIVVEEHSPADVKAVAGGLGREYVLQVEGRVVERSSKNPKMPTGDIEVVASKLVVLHEAEVPPFTIEENSDGGDDLRMKYRYLDLRWQEDGFILYQKRLEDGTFELPRFNPREDRNKIEWKTFMMIMSGISLNSVKYRKRLRL